MLEKIKEFIESVKTMLSNTSNETIVRTIVLFVMVINAGCSLMGWVPLDIDENTVYELVSAIGVVGASLWAWWKNNSFTSIAQAADEYQAELKASESATEDTTTVTE